eukprot:s3895_g6.t1
MTSKAAVPEKLEARPSNDAPAPPAAAAGTEALSKDKDCSPAASILSAETLPLDFWDQEDQPSSMEVDDDDWYSTFKHNPPRDVTLAYTDWMLGQKDGKCHCQWVQYCGKLARPVHVALPCVGIDGSGWALKKLGANFHCNNVYDLERRYDKYLETYMENAEPPHLGPKKGDVLNVELSQWERPVHLLLAGPPCPPWAGNGNHKGAEDDRAEVFLRIVNVVGSLAKCGELQAVVLENVKGILHKKKGQTESFMDKLVACLKSEIPEFLWDVSVLKAKEVLPPFGSRSLKEFLSPGMPALDRESLTPCMQKNLKDAQAQLKVLLDKGELEDSDLVCFPLDRADGKRYKRQICKDKVPTLTTSNGYLFVSDMKLSKADHERDFFRFLLPQERFTLQGFPPFIAESFDSQALQIKAAGNAYPVPLIAAAVAGLLEKIGPDDLPHVDQVLDDHPTLRHSLEQAMFAKREKKQPAKKTKTRPASSVRKQKTGESAPKESDACKTVDQAVNSPRRPLKRPASASSTMVAKKEPRFKDAWHLRGFLSSSSSSS